MQLRFDSGLVGSLSLAVSLAGCGHTEAPSEGSGGQAGSGGSSAGSAGAGGSGTAQGGSAGSTGGGGTSQGGSAGTAGSANCATPCGPERLCCSGTCVNPINDPLHCGDCETECTEDEPFCGAGTCSPPPCETTCPDPTACCGSACCAPNELCCDPQGPIETGPVCTLPSEQGSCPMGCAPLCICASPDTPIATPSGERAIAGLRPGDLVYSVEHGAIVVAPILETSRCPVRGHRVVRVTLESGSVLEISASHPTSDGRTFADLERGALLDGVLVKGAELVPYERAFTYDILPATSSGAYFAGGVLIGSSLAE